MSGENKTVGSFDELLKSLNEVAVQADTLAKGGAPDDKTVAAAAADSGVDAGAGEGEGDEDDEGEGEGEGQTITKSATGDELVDATDLLKSLMARLDTHDGVLAKALTGITGVVAKQNDMIKSLQTQVATLASQGRGRKTVVVATEKMPIGETLAKSGEAGDGGITPTELLAKSNAAFTGGKISGTEFNTIDVCLRNGWPIDPSVLTKVANA